MLASRRTFLALAAAALPLASRLAFAEEAFSVEGRYETLSAPQPTADPSKVEVLEVFWYGCPHCNHLQAYITPWREHRPDYVDFELMPAVFAASWEAQARAYYTARALGTLDKTHDALFNAIHEQGRRLDTEESLEKFFVEHGVDGDAFRKTFESFAVDSGVRRSKVMQARYGVRGVPAVIVNGKYRVTGSLAGSYSNMIKVIDALVDREHKAMLTSK